MNILDWPFIARTRRNHSLEHATIHILSARYPGRGIMGRSAPDCFYIYGNLTAEQVYSAAVEALARLRAGENHLAIHPSCGTNLVASGMLAGMAAFAAMNIGRRRSRWEALPMVISAVTLALLLAQPLGTLLQARVTTNSYLDTMEIIGIRRTNTAGLPVHRVDTRS